MPHRRVTSATEKTLRFSIRKISKTGGFFWLPSDGQLIRLPPPTHLLPQPANPFAAKQFEASLVNILERTCGFSSRSDKCCTKAALLKTIPRPTNQDSVFVELSDSTTSSTYSARYFLARELAYVCPARQRSEISSTTLRFKFAFVLQPKRKRHRFQIGL